MATSLSFRQIRYQDKRKKILQQAARLFAKKGYEKASLEEIASRLKLTKASLYHYFQSKEEVLFQIQMEAMDEILAEVESIESSDSKPVVKLKQIIIKYVQAATQKHIVGALRQQELILPEKWRIQIIAKRDRIDETCRKVILDGIASGEFSAVNWKMSYMGMIGALNWIVKWYSPQGDLSVDQICEAMVDFITKGFGVTS